MTDLVSTSILVLLVAGLILISLGSWVATVFGLPGTWMILASAIVYELLAPQDTRWQLGWTVCIALGILAVVGELIEFLAGAMGVAGRGGSRLSMMLALVGSLIGGVMGAVVGLPIPVVGSLVGVLFFSSVGAMIGAALGEDYQGRNLDESLEIGWAAFWGRMLGSLAKTLVATVMAAVVIVAVFF